MPTERLLVLASSKKLAGRCLAGISLETGKWVRPVSSLGGEALGIADCGIEGRYPRLLEIVRLETLEACPLAHQPENVLIPKQPWLLEPELAPRRVIEILSDHLEHGPDLLGSTARIFDAQACLAAPVKASLAIVEPQALSLENEQVPWRDGSRQWAHFRLGGASHSLTISDFVIGPRLKRKPFGSYRLGDLEIPSIRRPLITVSLAGAYDDRHYKLAAALFGIR